jgi:hypothetical protein
MLTDDQRKDYEAKIATLTQDAERLKGMFSEVVGAIKVMRLLLDDDAKARKAPKKGK